MVSWSAAANLVKVADIQPAIVASLGEIEKLPWIGIALAVGTITILPL